MGKEYDGKKFLPTIGSYFKEKREILALKQDTVSAETGISRSNVIKYEKGDVDMPASKIPELCHLYGCRMSECGDKVDTEMDFYASTESAVESAFKDAQYMSFSIGTPMVDAEYEVETENAFTQLVHMVSNFREYELERLQIPYQDKDRLRHNYDFFMIEFITKNEPNKERRNRLLALCNEAINKDKKNKN